MIHSFDPIVAKDVGIEAAILYQNIAYWCEKNKLNEKNIHEGLAWTYNSIKAFCDMFPYMSKDIISRNLKKLETSGYIKRGNFNKVGFDRTMWYADLRPNLNIQPSISEKSEMDFAKIRNGFLENQKPIPIDNNNNKPVDNKRENTKRDLESILDSVEVIAGDPELKQAFIDFIAMRKLTKKPLTDRALKLNINEAFKLAGGDPQKMKAIVNQSISHSWSGMYALKEDNSFNTKKQESKADFWERAMREAKQFDEQEAKNAETNLGLLLESTVGHISE